MKFSCLSVLALISAAASQTVLHPNTASNKCLEVRGDVLANGTAVQIFDRNGTPAQQWELNLGLTAVRLANPAFCLDAGTGTSSTYRTKGDATFIVTSLRPDKWKIWQRFDNLPAQEWFLTTDARIALFGKGLRLDSTNGDLTNTNIVQVWQCTDGDTNQIWRNF